MSVVVTESGRFLGKLDPVPSPFKRFEDYFEVALPAPPPQAHWGHVVPAPIWGMDGNGPDPLVTIAPKGWAGCGDCVEGFKAHALTTANYYPGVPVADDLPVPTANAVVENYAAMEGCTITQLFDDPNTYDNGEDMTTSLTKWAQAPQYGTKLAFTATVNESSQAAVKSGIYYGGGLGIGIQIQQAQENQFPGVWQWVSGSPTLGGHAIWLTGYDSTYVYLVTWGTLIAATWEFILNAIDEAHVVVMPQTVKYGKSPQGLLIPAWEQDLHNLAA